MEKWNDTDGTGEGYILLAIGAFHLIKVVRLYAVSSTDQTLTKRHPVQNGFLCVGEMSERYL